VLSFEGKRVLVTGASRGIGKACARVFGALGASVAVHYRGEREAAERVVAELAAAGVTARAVGADLADWDEGERLVAACEADIGPLDVVVLNHGIWKAAPIDAITEAQYDEMLDVNLRGYFSVAAASARRMKARRKGRMVLIASTAGQRGEPLHAHYAATKGAVISMTKSLAPELAPFGVLVNCVAPGWVATDMSRETLESPKDRAGIFAAIPLGRVASPEEIAWPVAFIASDMATFVTGEVLNVNGGAVLAG
jgi:3-oxoacyl-[acyl-carrier protein] reductase